MRSKNVTPLLIPAFLVLAATAMNAQELQKEEVPGIRNYTQVNATVACAGATTLEALEEVQRRGFVSVVNFRTEGENGANPAGAAEKAAELGMKYFHIPFRSSEPWAEAAEEFLKVIAEPVNQPTFVHCGSAKRVGAMWLIKRVKLDGWDVERATVEAEAIGMRSPALKEFALAYVR